MDFWWKCPNCNNRVDFTSEMSYVFDENGEAVFDAESGITLHTIQCDECGADWFMSMSGMAPGSR